MSETIGKRLRAARVAKGISIDDAAFETRIQPSYIRHLEHDDYSGFASTTYAKSFLTLYSRYLGVEAEDALQYFAGTDDLRLGGPGFIPTLSSTVSAGPSNHRPESRPIRSRAESPGFAPMFLGTVVALLVVAIPVLWYIGKDAGSIEEATSKAKAIADATKQEFKPAAADSAPDDESQNATVGTGTPPAGSTRPSPVPQPSVSLAHQGNPKGAAADWVIETSRLENPAKAPAAAPATAKPLAARPFSGGDTLGAPETSAANPTSSDLAPAPETVRTGPFAPLHASPISLDADPFASAPDPASPPPATKPKAKVTTAPPPASDAQPATPPPAVRATPLIAVPFVPQAEPATEEGKKPEEPPFTDPRNRFPRPVEPEN